MRVHLEDMGWCIWGHSYGFIPCLLNMYAYIELVEIATATKRTGPLVYFSKVLTNRKTIRWGYRRQRRDPSDWKSFWVGLYRRYNARKLSKQNGRYFVWSSPVWRLLRNIRTDGMVRHNDMHEKFTSSALKLLNFSATA